MSYCLDLRYNADKFSVDAASILGPLSEHFYLNIYTQLYRMAGKL